MSCDIRICSENAVFGQPEVGLGITPGFGGPAAGPSGRLWHGQADGLAALNIKAEKALRIGLVEPPCSPCEEVMPAALKAGFQDRPNAPIAVRNCKEGYQRRHPQPAYRRLLRSRRALRRLLRDPRSGRGYGLLPEPREAEAETGLHQQLISASGEGRLRPAPPPVLKRTF